MTKTVRIPDAINTTVATVDRLENRAIPHTVWPLVQPLPSRVPKPTNNPAAMAIESAGEFEWERLAAHRRVAQPVELQAQHESCAPRRITGDARR